MDINKKGLTASDFYKDRLTYVTDKESGEVHTTSDWDEVTGCMDDFADYKTKQLESTIEFIKLVCIKSDLANDRRIILIMDELLKTQ